MSGHPATLQGFGRIFSIGGGGQEIAAQAEEEPDLASPHLFDCFHGVGAMLSGRSELKFLAELLHESVAHAFPDSHGAIALHVGMAADRTGSRAGPADVAAEQHKIHDLLDSGDGILVLGQPHRPAANDAFAPHRDPRGLLNLRARQSAGGEDVFPGRGPEMLHKRVETGRVFLDKFAIKNRAGISFLRGQHFLHDSAQRRHVAVEPDGQP